MLTKSKILANIYRYNKWPLGQAVKTPPSQGGIMSSILVRVTIYVTLKGSSFKLLINSRDFSILFA